MEVRRTPCVLLSFCKNCLMPRWSAPPPEYTVSGGYGAGRTGSGMPLIGAVNEVDWGLDAEAADEVSPRPARCRFVTSVLQKSSMLRYA